MAFICAHRNLDHSGASFSLNELGTYLVEVSETCEKKNKTSHTLQTDKALES